MRSIDRIAAFAKANGVRLVTYTETGPQPPRTGTNPSPTCERVGFDRERRELYLCRPRDGDRAAYRRAVGNLIHELGHMLALNPRARNEVNFVYWEWCVSVALGPTIARYWWLAGMADYGVDWAEVSSFGDLTAAQKLAWLQDVRRKGIKAGNVCPKTDRPIAVNGPLAGKPWCDRYLKPARVLRYGAAV
jgi:hypothetical protein